MKFFISILFLGFFILSCQTCQTCQKKPAVQNSPESTGVVQVPAQQLLNAGKEEQELNSFLKQRIEEKYKEKYHSYYIRLYEKLLEKHPDNLEYQKKLKQHQESRGGF